MGDVNPICTLGDYFRPSHEGYRNTIELAEWNNVVPLRSDTIRSNAEMPLKEAEKENGAENRTKNKLIKSEEKELTQPEEEEAVEPSSSQHVGYYLKHKIKEKLIEGLVENYRKLTNERPVETDIRLFLASHLYIYPLGIAKDILVDVAGYVYPIEFVILDIKEDEKRPFILGTPFLTTAKAVIKFNKGNVTLRFGKSNMSFHMIPESLCKIEKRIKNDIEPNRLVLNGRKG
uniref:Reverse transcriptase domain-containing protein n=1 Tax=Tanacetum cinerariifolium TaxID=118510 RepID=A0A6L2KQQ2_TANCI|nr:hypothetical protein [Tanacetum cinerariifolium]